MLHWRRRKRRRRTTRRRRRWWYWVVVVVEEEEEEEEEEEVVVVVVVVVLVLVVVKDVDSNINGGAEHNDYNKDDEKANGRNSMLSFIVHLHVTMRRNSNFAVTYFNENELAR
jgi:transposase